MVKFDRMIMIGSTTRQSGKTELAAMIIKAFSKREKISAVKITSLQDDDSSFHKSIALPENTFFSIQTCTQGNADKSTDRMLLAGANEAFWIHSRADYLAKAWDEFRDVLSPDSFIVCESGSLRKIIEPGVFIMIRNLNKEIKQSSKKHLQQADYVIDFNGEGFTNFDLNKIRIKNGKWILN